MSTPVQSARASGPVETAPFLGGASLYWICQIAGWGTYAITRFCGAVLYLHMEWREALADVLLLHGAALAFTHLLRGYVTRHDWASLGRPRLALRIFLVGLLLGLPMGIATQLTPLSAFQDPSILFTHVQLTVAPAIVLWLNVVNWAATFVLWLVLYFGVLAVRRRKSAELRQSELTRALQLAELRLLKAQLNPHFLFNSLNTVRSLIAEDPARAQDAVTRLANTLRYTLSCDQEEFAPLEREMAIVEDYLRLESLRLEDRLRIDRYLSPEALGVRIPVMLLQTLVENGIKHGIALLPQGGTLSIRAEVRDDMLQLEVSNPRMPSRSSALQGPASATASEPSIDGFARNDGEGIGLRNAAGRLRLLFGPSAGLEVDFKPGTAAVRVRIPVNA